METSNAQAIAARKIRGAFLAGTKVQQIHGSRGKDTQLRTGYGMGFDVDGEDALTQAYPAGCLEHWPRIQPSPFVRFLAIGRETRFHALTLKKIGVERYPRRDMRYEAPRLISWLLVPLLVKLPSAAVAGGHCKTLHAPRPGPGRGGDHAEAANSSQSSPVVI